MISFFEFVFGSPAAANGMHPASGNLGVGQHPRITEIHELQNPKVSAE